MLNAVRFTGFKKKTAGKVNYSYALLLFSISSLVLSGCSGFVNANNSGAPSTLTVTNIQASAPTTSGFQVGWTTNLASNSSVDYGTSASYGATTPVSSSMVTSHQLSITNLTKGTLYHFRVRSIDSKNDSAVSPDMTFPTAGDVTPPTVSIGAPAANSTIAGTTTLTASASDNVAVADVQFKVDNANTGAPISASPYSYSLNTTTLSNGNHILTAVATDTSGNSTTSAGVAVKVNNNAATVPSITSLSPTSGLVGASVTVTGTNFGATQSTSTVTFNGKTAAATTWSATSIVATVPAGATTGNVVVTVGGVSSNGMNFTVTLPTPAITSLNPNSGLIGASVTIAGANFGATQGSSTIKFNGTAATPTSWSATSLAAPVPAGATTGNVVVTVGGVSSNGVNFSVTVPTPQINSLNPTSGLVGTSVTIAGSNFGATQGTNTVKFNGTTAAPKSWSASSIVASVPTGATTGNVVVTVSGVASNGVSFTVQADTTPPTVPSGLAASALSSSQINLSWTASTDNAGVTGYNVYRAGTKIGTSGTTTYLDSGLSASTSYAYNVSAFDAAGNTSAQSAGASATTPASSGGGGIPSALGWYQIPNTQLKSVCPPNNYGGSGYAFSDNCPNVISAWNGGVADTSRNRLIVWGGGHVNYSGNEIYALDLNSLTMLRLNNPAVPVSTNCGEALSGPSPNSRHSYDDISYLANVDQLAVVTGSLATCGGASRGTWTLNMANLQWTQKTPAGTAPNYTGGLAATSYDPNTNKLFIHTLSYAQFASYDYGTNTYTPLHSGAVIDYHQTSIIDPTRKLFFTFGNGQAWRIDISGNDPTYNWKSVTATGCSGFVNQGYPGLAFDTVQKLIVGWAGGNTVYMYNPDTDSCTSATYTGGPGAQQTNGTFKRFSYFPQLNVFAVVNSSTQNAYTLRLTSSGGTGGGSGPVLSGIAVTSISTTGATTSWTTDVPATTQVEYGSTTAYGNLTTPNASLVTAHSVPLTGLSAGTLYHYRVHSKNSSGVESISADAAFSTNSTTDTTPPTVSLTAPASGASLSGSVTVSANASDNVGVASVQFTIDGASIGSALTSSPYQVSWDTTKAANGAHALSAVARDAVGNVGNASGISVTVSNSTSTALQDFQTRCAQTGVILCQGFDDPAVFAPAAWPASGIYVGASATYAAYDSAVSASGSGSLRFTVPSMAGPNDSGYWRQLMTPNLSAGPGSAAMFGANSTFYVQFRQRFSPEFLTNQWPANGGGLTWWKQEIFSNDSSTCGQIELTTVNEYNRGFPQMYSQCGADNFDTPVGSSDFLLEQGDTSSTGYNCHYQSANNTAGSCFLYPANTWVTFYYKVSIGNWSQPDSTIQAWVSVGGQPYKEWINMTNHKLNEDSGSAGKDYNTVSLMPYMTQRNSGVSAGPTAYTWYDELIVSRSPIAAPNN
jgi:hypothetical protein